MAEFALIERIRALTRVARDDVLLGIGDDAALTLPPADGEAMATAVDTLVAGIHFPDDTPAYHVGWKSLAVNLSDLAAMGARPAHALLALTLPDADETWIEGYARGFAALAREHGVALIGGDTTRGPLSVSVTVIGSVAPSLALRRDAAQPGDLVCVSGALGDAAAGLEAWFDGDRAGAALPLIERLLRPLPRVATGLALRGWSRCAIDLSDGLAADLQHVCDASAVGIELDLDALPVSAPLAARYDRATVQRLQLAGGDDYELCYSVPPHRLDALRAAVGADACHVVGRVVAGERVRLLRRDGSELALERRGYQHFT